MLVCQLYSYAFSKDHTVSDVTGDTLLFIGE